MKTCFTLGILLSIESSFLVHVRGIKVNVRGDSAKKKDDAFKRGTMNAIADFEESTKCTTYVDKTSMIEDFFKNSGPRQYDLITCPHKFGKSTNLDMMKRFVEAAVDSQGDQIKEKYDPTTDQLFHKFKIWPFLKKANDLYKDNFQQYSVIYMTFKVTPARTYREMLDGIHLNFKTCYQHHFRLYNLLKSKSQMSKVMERILWERMEIEDDVVDGIPELAKLLKKYYPSSKIFLFIDDYDDPLIKAIEHNFDVDKVWKLMKRVYQKLFDPDDRDIQRALITGTLNVLSDSFNSIKHWSFLDDNHFTKYFGLMENEVEELLNKHGLNAHDEEMVKSYYGSYNIPSSSDRIYNPYSIAKYLCSRDPNNARLKLKNYWAQSSKVSNFPLSSRQNYAYRKLFSNLMSFNKITFSLEKQWNLDDLEEIKMMRHARDDKLTSRRTDLILSYLFHHGFLSYADTWSTFKVVSDEVMNVLVNQSCTMETDHVVLDMAKVKERLAAGS